MPQLGPMEVLVVLVIALMVFGPERLPDMARKVGRFMNEVRRMADEVKEEFHTGLDMDDESEVGDEQDVDVAPEHPVAGAIAEDNGQGSPRPETDAAPPLARLKEHKPADAAALPADDDVAPDTDAPPIARLDVDNGRAARSSDSGAGGGET